MELLKYSGVQTFCNTSALVTSVYFCCIPRSHVFTFVAESVLCSWFEMFSSSEGGIKRFTQFHFEISSQPQLTTFDAVQNVIEEKHYIDTKCLELMAVDDAIVVVKDSSVLRAYAGGCVCRFHLRT